MKKCIILSVLLCILTVFKVNSKNKDSLSMQKRIELLSVTQRYLKNNISISTHIIEKNKRDIQSLVQRNEILCESIDSLKTICDSLGKIQTADKVDINGKIKNTNNAVNVNKSMLESRTLLGCAVAVIILAVLSSTYYLLIRRIKTGISSIDEVRKAQDALQTANTKMQEEAVKLDNKLLELVEKQMQIAMVMTTSNTIDHSLALKVADEIVRIEMNLSRMDASIKGYKQLSKAVQRIRYNFNANGYDIVDMLGKPYNAGMKAAVTFVTDENLEKGQQIITKIIKPQINYQQQMIQAAEIEVSQPE